MAKANSWWEQAPTQTYKPNWEASIGNFAPVYPSSSGAPQAPSQWAKFRADFGDGFASKADYDTWLLNQQMGTSAQSFVDRMFQADPNQDQFQSQMAQDYGGFRDAMTNWINSAGPTMNQSNRFEGGLSVNEARLNRLLNDPDSIQQTAAYRFRLKQGEDALQRNLAAKGMLMSGNRLQALAQYGQDMASQEYDNQARRLSDLVGMYGKNWLEDKNANTNAFAATSDAWTKRGATLADLVGKAGTNYTNAIKTGADQRLGWGNIWAQSRPKVLQTAGVAPGTTAFNWS